MPSLPSPLPLPSSPDCQAVVYPAASAARWDPAPASPGTFSRASREAGRNMFFFYRPIPFPWDWYMGVSENSGFSPPPNHPILIGFSMK